MCTEIFISNIQQKSVSVLGAHKVSTSFRPSSSPFMHIYTEMCMSLTYKWKFVSVIYNPQGLSPSFAHGTYISVSLEVLHRDLYSKRTKTSTNTLSVHVIHESVRCTMRTLTLLGTSAGSGAQEVLSIWRRVEASGGRGGETQA